MKKTVVWGLVLMVALSMSMISGCTESHVEEDVAIGIVESERRPYDENSIRFTKDKVNLYSEKSNESDILGELIKFSKLELIETEDEGEALWSLVHYAVGNEFVEGYVSSDQIIKNIGQDFRKGYTDLDYMPKHKVENYTNNPRQQVRALYVSLNSAVGNIDKYIQIANDTKVNAFVIDVKNDLGYTLFEMEVAEKFSPMANKGPKIKDIEQFMQKLKENEIYTIARVVTFKDTLYAQNFPERGTVYRDSGALYQSRDKLYWGSPYDRQFWEYNIEIAKVAADVGFNEIQFDYVRFPDATASTNAKLNFRNELDETKAECIQNFLKEAYEVISEKEVYVAADLFGLVGTVADDMGIGQHWESISNVIDFVCPMMYPSHYGKYNYGLPVPDQFPYETVYYSTEDSIERNMNIATPAAIRPWIQDFTATWVPGYIRYGDAELLAQIKALEDLDIHEYMLWNAGNNYHTNALK
ncbi:MAG: putative glycoside hydrolase [Peptostreptococcales bacterium]